MAGDGSGWQRNTRSPVSRGLGVAIALFAVALVPTATAHEGTTHAGTPHWFLLIVSVLGVSIVATAIYTIRRSWYSSRVGVIGLLAGLVLAIFGTIGLVETQLEAATDPSTTLLALHPIASLVVGFTVVIGSQAVTLHYWPKRPRYSILGAILGFWILYPVLMPDGGINNPVGYALVLALPITLAFILWQDAGDAIRSILADRFTKVTALLTALVVWIVLSFSAGTLTVVPETNGVPDEPFLVTIGVADPLVVWPAIEFYLPSIPLFGMLSVGTIILFGMLATLLGINVALVAEELRTHEGSLSPGFLVGTVSTTGATACGCCAPAMYGVLSATLGASATPIYWSFMDTSSPLSGTFLAASVLLLTASVIRAAGTRRERAPTPRSME